MKEPPPLIQLVHWKEAELPERAKRIRDAGYRVRSEPIDGKAALSKLVAASPAAIIIDLSRLPSHGRSTAFVLRQQKRTRTIPLVFIGGAPEKVASVREIIPDAIYSEWPSIKAALKKAMATTRNDAIVPISSSGGYSGTPLTKKLGIKENSTLILLRAPQHFDDTLGVLPPGVVRRSGNAHADLLIVFVRSLADLRKAIKYLRARGDESPVWIAWPKKTSPLARDVSETQVRNEGLAAGMVDFKVCAIDADWSGLKFSRKRKRST